MRGVKDKRNKRFNSERFRTGDRKNKSESQSRNFKFRRQLSNGNKNSERTTDK